MFMVGGAKRNPQGPGDPAQGRMSGHVRVREGGGGRTERPLTRFPGDPLGEEVRLILT